GHLILKLTYQELIDRGYFSGEASAVDIESTLTTIAQRAFAEHASNNPVGYPLAWEILQEGLTQLLRQVVARDLQEISVSGYLPVAVEVDAEEQWVPKLPEPLNGLPILARMDRHGRQETIN